MISLDWLSIVLDDDRPEVLSYLRARLVGALAVTLETGGGLHGYENSIRGDGVVIAFGGASQKHTVLVSLSGLACSALGWYGSAALVRALIARFHLRVKFSRVDLALDVVGEWWQYFDSPDRVLERIQDGRVKSITIVNNYQRQEDLSGFTENWIVSGHTTYIGSRTSERFMRIYKKQKDDGSKVTRFEYELKERYAAVVGSMMLSGANAGECYIFANSRHVDISDIYDLSVMYDEPLAVSLPKKKETSRFQWLMRVSAALVQFMEDCPEMWDTVVQEGYARSPVGNTGVQISIPQWLYDIDQQALNMETFGMIFHPIHKMR